MIHCQIAHRPTARRRIARLAAACAVLGLLAACDNTPPPEHFPEIRFASYPPIKLNAERLDVVREYAPSSNPPHIDTQAPRTLMDSAVQWAHDRLQPVGSSGWIRFVITDASLTEVPLQVKKGLSYSFTTQQDKRDDAHVAVRIEIHNARGYTDGEVTAEASASRTIAQDASQREIDEARFLVVQDAMLRLNSQLDVNIASHLHKFLAP
jgi:hypothetical protein